jgi:hypothetical protein
VLSTKSAVYSAPAIAARVVEFFNSADMAPYVVVENLDDAASAAIKFQESDDGSTWVDIASTTATVNPGDANAQSVVASRSRIALHAGGNVSLNVHVVRQINGAPSNLGSA